MQVQSLGWQDALEEGMATHSSILAWRITIDREDLKVLNHDLILSKFQEIAKDREACVLQFMGSQTVRHDCVTEQQQMDSRTPGQKTPA